MYQVKAYHCDFCRKILANAARMTVHEKICLKNPETRSCATCLHLQEKNVSSGDGEQKTTDFYCELYKMIPENERTKRNPLGLRTKCEFWQKKFNNI
jgi:hypothetical protein